MQIPASHVCLQILDRNQVSLKIPNCNRVPMPIQADHLCLQILDCIRVYVKIPDYSCVFGLSIPLAYMIILLYHIHCTKSYV